MLTIRYVSDGEESEAEVYFSVDLLLVRKIECCYAMYDTPM